MQDDPAFPIYALAAAILAIQFVGLAVLTGGVRAARKVFVNPEDAVLNKGQQGPDHPDTERVKRAHSNALENGIPFLVVGLLYVLTGGTKLGAEIYFGTFVAARLLHSVFYLKGAQPFRTMSFALGALVILALAVHVVRVAI